MQVRNSLKIVLLLLTVFCLCPNNCKAQLVTVLYENFDDGDYAGWSALWPPANFPWDAPDIVTSPQGYALRGVGSGYSGNANTVLSRELLLSNIDGLEIEVRAKSGPQWPNSISVALYDGTDAYYISVSGESHNYAQWAYYINGVEPLIPYSFNPNDWHDYSWRRDADGWWSLRIDNNLMWENFYQDIQLTSFDTIAVYLTRNQSEIEWLRISADPQEVVANVDIKPGSCPNPLNVKDKGMIPVAILGSDDFDVFMIDVASIRLESVSPVRSSYQDVSTPLPDGSEICECTTEEPDGYLDLTLKFKAQEIIAALDEINNGDELELTLTGVLNDGTPIKGSDCVVIIKKDKQ